MVMERRWKAVYMKKTGIPVNCEVPVKGVTYDVIATIPAIEALEIARAKVVLTSNNCYRVTLTDRVPDKMVAVSTSIRPPFFGIRMEYEPEYPFEVHPVEYQACFTPCPICRAPLVQCISDGDSHQICIKAPHHHVVMKSTY